MDYQDFLSKVNKDITQTLQAKLPKQFNLLKKDIINICLSKQAKKIRAKLVFILYSSFSNVTENDAIKIAASAELTHLASLLHDDIIDNALKRRNQATLHSIYNIPTAILIGDWLLGTVCVELLNKISQHKEKIVKESLQTIVDMSSANMKEYLQRYNTNITLEDWMQIAKGKTGSLCGFCGYVITLLSNEKDIASKMQEITTQLGILFQLADDIFDFIPYSNKEVYQDLKNGNPNYILIHILQNKSPLRMKIKKLYQQKSETKLPLKLFFSSNRYLERTAHKLLPAILEDPSIYATLNKFQETLKGIKNTLNDIQHTTLYLKLKKWLQEACLKLNMQPNSTQHTQYKHIISQMQNIFNKL